MLLCSFIVFAWRSCLVLLVTVTWNYVSYLCVAQVVILVPNGQRSSERGCLQSSSSPVCLKWYLFSVPLYYCNPLLFPVVHFSRGKASPVRFIFSFVFSFKKSFIQVSSSSLLHLNTPGTLFSTWDSTSSIWAFAILALDHCNAARSAPPDLSAHHTYHWLESIETLPLQNLQSSPLVCQENKPDS